jgi:glycosyltransferase involved in cell wall biosynthesis
MRRVKVAWWSPLPPARSGIADYSYTLLEELRSRIEIAVVVREDTVSFSVAPPGVDVVSPSERRTIGSAVDIYHMGNHPILHEYMHRSILESPGLLVLHDPALVDFYWGVCGGPSSSTFREEVEFNVGRPWPPAKPGSEGLGHAVDVANLDRLELLMSKRLVEASLATVVHSRWAAGVLESRSPKAEVHQIPLFCEARSVVPPPSAGRIGRCVVGAMGGVSAPKRLCSVVSAVARSRRDGSDVSLIVAGWPHDPSAVEDLRRCIAAEGMGPHVRVELDVELDRMRELFDESDVIAALRWPTAGETSAVVSRALAAGRPVIVSNVPQNRELSPELSWTVPVGEDEVRKLSRVLTQLAASPELRVKACDAASRYAAEEASPRVVGLQFVELIESCFRRQLQPSRFPRMDHDSPPPVNAIGSWTATTGLAEAARRTVAAMLDAGIEVALDDIDSGAPRRSDRLPSRFVSLPAGRPYEVDVCFLNVNEIGVVTDERLRGPGRPRRLIGHWYWELPAFPAHFARQVARVDEIWVASRFVAEAFGALTSVPVLMIPSPVEPSPDPSLSRRDFGLPAGACVYLFSFDAHSTLARKNPWDVIRAFRKAFDASERREDVRLVMKTLNLSSLPEAREQLRAELAAVNGILIEDHLSARETASLFSCADVYVSLHRSEGFGLGMAESMALGVPVIATAYSGNMDFMTATNSWPIPYSIVKVNEAELRFNPNAESVYVPGSQWAAPDVLEASRAMRVLYHRPALRRKLGLEASRTIRERYTPGEAGRQIKKRLREIATDPDSVLAPRDRVAAGASAARRALSDRSTA